MAVFMVGGDTRFQAFVRDTELPRIAGAYPHITLAEYNGAQYRYILSGDAGDDCGRMDIIVNTSSAGAGFMMRAVLRRAARQCIRDARDGIRRNVGMGGCGHPLFEAQMHYGIRDTDKIRFMNRILSIAAEG